MARSWEWECEHGVGHPKPSAKDQIHGCDGCCGGGPVKQTVLTEAEGIVQGARQKDYGHPLDNWSDTAAIVNGVLRKKLAEPLTAEDLILCMIGVKLARLSNAFTHDSLVDVAGYARCLELIREERSKREGR